METEYFIIEIKYSVSGFKIIVVLVDTVDSRVTPLWLLKSVKVSDPDQCGLNITRHFVGGIRPLTALSLFNITPCD